MEDGEEVVYFYGLVRDSAVRPEGARMWSRMRIAVHSAALADDWAVVGQAPRR